MSGQGAKERAEAKLLEFVKKSTPEELFSWRKEGRTLLQEVVDMCYWRTLDYLFSANSQALPEDLPDDNGNYGVHIAATHGQLRVAAFLAARLPDRHFLKRNHKGESALVLAAACLKLAWVDLSAKERFFDLLELTPDEALPEALTSTHKGKNVFETLLSVGAMFWPYTAMKSLRERERGEELLCVRDSLGKNVAHYLAMRSMDWRSSQFSPVYVCTTRGLKRMPIRPPSVDDVLDTLPEAAFTQADSSGHIPLHDASMFARSVGPYPLLGILTRTPEVLRYSEKGCPEVAEILHRLCSDAQGSVEDVLPQFLAVLPPGAADMSSAQGVALFSAVRGGWWNRAVEKILVKNMTEEGLLYLKDGESFLHLAVRTIFTSGSVTYPPRNKAIKEEFVKFLRNDVADRVSIQELLALCDSKGRTASDLALALGMPDFAQALRLGGPKRAI